jgi:hypothetical protein
MPKRLISTRRLPLRHQTHLSRGLTRCFARREWRFCDSSRGFLHQVILCSLVLDDGSKYQSLIRAAVKLSDIPRSRHGSAAPLVNPRSPAAGQNDANFGAGEEQINLDKGLLRAHDSDFIQMNPT